MADNNKDNDLFDLSDVDELQRQAMSQSKESNSSNNIDIDDDNTPSVGDIDSITLDDDVPTFSSDLEQGEYPGMPDITDMPEVPSYLQDIPVFIDRNDELNASQHESLMDENPEFEESLVDPDFPGFNGHAAYQSSQPQEPEAPEAAEPESQEPEAPEATEPESQEPEAPEAAEPESQEPEAPEATEPESQEPEAPEAAEPESQEPEAPESAEPESQEPEAPEATEPESQEPEVPEAAEPESQEPEAPEATEPDENTINEEKVEMNNNSAAEVNLDFSSDADAKLIEQLNQKVAGIVAGGYDGISDAALQSLGQEKDQEPNEQTKQFLQTFVGLSDNEDSTTSTKAFEDLYKFQMSQLYLKEIEKKKENDAKMEELLGKAILNRRSDFEDQDMSDEKAIVLFRSLYDEIYNSVAFKEEVEAVNKRIEDDKPEMLKQLSEAGFSDAEISSLGEQPNAINSLSTAKMYDSEILGNDAGGFTNFLKEKKGQILGFLAKPNTGLALTALAFTGAVASGGVVPLALSGVKLAAKMHDHPQVQGAFNKFADKAEKAAASVGVNIGPAISKFRGFMNGVSKVAKSKTFQLGALALGAGGLSYALSDTVEAAVDNAIETVDAKVDDLVVDAATATMDFAENNNIKGLVPDFVEDAAEKSSNLNNVEAPESPTETVDSKAPDAPADDKAPESPADGKAPESPADGKAPESPVDDKASASNGSERPNNMPKDTTLDGDGGLKAIELPSDVPLEVVLHNHVVGETGIAMSDAQLSALKDAIGITDKFDPSSASLDIPKDLSFLEDISGNHEVYANIDPVVTPADNVDITTDQFAIDYANANPDVITYVIDDPQDTMSRVVADYLKDELGKTPTDGQIQAVLGDMGLDSSTQLDQGQLINFPKDSSIYTQDSLGIEMDTTTVVAGKGDSVWSLASEHLEEQFGNKPSDREIMNFVNELGLEDPNSLNPGDKLVFPTGDVSGFKDELISKVEQQGWQKDPSAFIEANEKAVDNVQVANEASSDPQSIDNAQVASEISNTVTSEGILGFYEKEINAIVGADASKFVEANPEFFTEYMAVKGEPDAVIAMLEPGMEFNTPDGGTVSLSSLEDAVASVAFEDGAPNYLDKSALVDKIDGANPNLDFDQRMKYDFTGLSGNENVISDVANSDMKFDVGAVDFTASQTEFQVNHSVHGSNTYGLEQKILETMYDGNVPELLDRSAVIKDLAEANPELKSALNSRESGYISVDIVVPESMGISPTTEPSASMDAATSVASAVDKGNGALNQDYLDKLSQNTKDSGMSMG